MSGRIIFALTTMALAMSAGMGMDPPGMPRMDPEPPSPPLPPRRRPAIFAEEVAAEREARQLRRYDGPRVEHVHTRGRSKGTRRSRKAARS